MVLMSLDLKLVNRCNNSLITLLEILDLNVVHVQMCNLFYVTFSEKYRAVNP